MREHPARTKEAQEGDLIDAACIGLSDVEINAVWDRYVEKGYPSAIGLAAGYKAVYKLKQGPAGAFDRELEEIRQAVDELARTQGNDQVRKILRSLIQQLGQMSPASGRAPVGLADDESVTQKDTPVLPGGLLGSVQGINDGSIPITDLRPR